MSKRAGTKAEYARQKGWSKAYLSKADVKERLIEAEFIDAADGKKKLDFDKADEIFERTSDPSRQAGADDAQPAAGSGGMEQGQPPAGAGFHAVKTLREELKYKEEKLAYEVRLGNTLVKEDVKNACIHAGKTLQDKLKSRNKRIAEQLQTINDPLLIKAKLDESDREILQEISDALAERLFSPSSAPVSTH